MQFLGHQNALKYVFGGGSAPDPAGRAYTTPSDPLRPIKMGKVGKFPWALQRLGASPSLKK